MKYANEVDVVVRLKGGDPSVFGRLEEELEALAQAGIACEVVPGVTAAIAAAAATQRPLTRRGSGRSVSLTTAMTREGQLHAARTADTEVFYMAGKQLAALSRRLVAAGWAADTPVSVVSRAGWPDQLHSDHTVADTRPRERAACRQADGRDGRRRRRAARAASAAQPDASRRAGRPGRSPPKMLALPRRSRRRAESTNQELPP